MRSILCLMALSPAAVLGQSCTQFIPVTVTDQNTGALIASLKPDTFKAKVGKNELQITSLDLVPTRRMVVLVDVSGSMAPDSSIHFSYQDKVLPLINKTLNELLQNLPPRVSVEYGLFNGRWAFTEPFTADRDQLRNQIDDLTLRFRTIGKRTATALYDSMHEGFLRFGSHQAGDTILLLTDGGENQSKLVAKKLEHELKLARVRLLTILIVKSDPEPVEKEGREWLENLATNTGGSLLIVDMANTSWMSNKGAQQNLDVVRRFWTERVLSGYVVGLQVPAGFKNERKWTLVVNRAADPQLKHARVIYPERLSPCP